jgi:hypothetical protein
VILIAILSQVVTCFADAKENKFVLQRIKAEEGDGSEVKVILRTGRFAKGEIYDITDKDVKKDFIQESPAEMIIISNGIARLYTTDQHTLMISGEFLVDNSLKMTVKGSWNGKKNGAVHMLTGKIVMFDYEFDSNSKYPFIFKMTDDGYEYQGGAGRVKDLQTGEVYVLFAQERAIDEFEGKLFDRLSCEKECCELLVKGQIKQGVTIQECVRALCK